VPLLLTVLFKSATRNASMVHPLVPDEPALEATILETEALEAPPRRWLLNAPALVALGLFTVMAIVALVTGSKLLEPDDYAYRASIEALRSGHIWLTNAQYTAMLKHFASLDGGHGMGIAQWIHQANGHWISEKNPGYPFFAVPFSWLGILKVTPIFYGGLASIALYLGGRRWLGRWGGTATVGLFCSSGAAMVFAWRSAMPTFTDASMVAAGCGLLLWTLLATEATDRRRMFVGLLGLASFDAAAFMRYTDLVALVVAGATLTLVWLLARRGIPKRAMPLWIGSQVLFGAFLVWVNFSLYGHAFSTGYSSGEITFSLGALSGNLNVMPKNLLVTMPMMVLAVISVVWIGIAAVRARGAQGPQSTAKRDLAVAAGLTAVWLGVFGLYFCYDWTARMGMEASSWGEVHVIRFYVPAIGALALLGAWLLVKMPLKLAGLVVVGLMTLGLFSFHAMATSAMPGGPGGFGHSGKGLTGCPNFPKMPALRGNGGPPMGGPPGGASGGFRPPAGFTGQPPKGMPSRLPGGGGFPGRGGTLPKLPANCR